VLSIGSVNAVVDRFYEAAVYAARRTFFFEQKVDDVVCRGKEKFSNVCTLAKQHWCKVEGRRSTVPLLNGRI